MELLACATPAFYNRMIEVLKTARDNFKAERRFLHNVYNINSIYYLQQAKKLYSTGCSIRTEDENLNRVFNLIRIHKKLRELNPDRVSETSFTALMDQCGIEYANTSDVTEVQGFARRDEYGQTLMRFAFQEAEEMMISSLLIMYNMGIIHSFSEVRMVYKEGAAQAESVLTGEGYKGKGKIYMVNEDLDWKSLFNEIETTLERIFTDIGGNMFKDLRVAFEDVTLNDSSLANMNKAFQENLRGETEEFTTINLHKEDVDASGVLAVSSPQTGKDVDFYKEISAQLKKRIKENIPTSKRKDMKPLILKYEARKFTVDTDAVIKELTLLNYEYLVRCYNSDKLPTGSNNYPYERLIATMRKCKFLMLYLYALYFLKFSDVLALGEGFIKSGFVVKLGPNKNMEDFILDNPSKQSAIRELVRSHGTLDRVVHHLSEIESLVKISTGHSLVEHEVQYFMLAHAIYVKHSKTIYQNIASVDLKNATFYRFAIFMLNSACICPLSACSNSDDKYINVRFCTEYDNVLIRYFEKMEKKPPVVKDPFLVSGNRTTAA